MKMSDANSGLELPWNNSIHRWLKSIGLEFVQRRTCNAKRNQTVIFLQQHLVRGSFGS